MPSRVGPLEDAIDLHPEHHCHEPGHLQRHHDVCDAVPEHAERRGDGHEVGGKEQQRGCPPRLRVVQVAVATKLNSPRPSRQPSLARVSMSWGDHVSTLGTAEAASAATRRRRSGSTPPPGGPGSSGTARFLKPTCGHGNVGGGGDGDANVDGRIVQHPGHVGKVAVGRRAVVERRRQKHGPNGVAGRRSRTRARTATTTTKTTTTTTMTATTMTMRTTVPSCAVPSLLC